MTEAVLYSQLKRNLPKVHWVRIENVIKSGIPDTEAAYNNRSVYIELKHQPTAKSKVYIRPAQRNFWLQRSKVSVHLWVLILQTHDNEIYACRAKDLLPKLHQSIHKFWILRPPDVLATRKLMFKANEGSGYKSLLNLLFT